MAYPVTLNGRTYTLADFTGQNYVSGFPDALEDFVTDAAAKVAAAELAETNAETAETNAEASATAAAASATAAQASLDAIEGLYLGAQASNPTVDLNGDPLTAGDWYFNTTSNSAVVYDGSAWNTITSYELSTDTTPQLGGDLDVNGQAIVSTSNGNIAITPDGTGEVDISKVDIDGGAIDGTVIGGTTAAAGIFTDLTATGTISFPDNSISGDDIDGGTISNFASTGIDDNATSTAITIDSSERTSFSSSTNRPVSVVSTSTNSFVTFQDTNSASIGHVKIGSETNDMVFYANAQERMRIKAGNVGIGEPDPDAHLHLTNTTAPVLRFERNDTNVALGNGIGQIQFAHREAGSEGVAALLRVEAGDSVGSGEFVFETGLADTTIERLRIDHDGNVGIGTSDPANTLHVHTPAGGAQLRVTNTNTGQTSSDGFHIGTDTPGGVFLVQNEAQPMYFYTSNAERMRLDASGNLLVGTTSASEISSYPGGLVSKTSNVPFVGYRPTTNVGVSLLALASDVGSSKAAKFSVRADGDVLSATNSYGSLSDERLKSNIVDASPQLDDVMAVQVRSYTLDSTGDTHIGVVAQELEASGMSGLVQEDEEGMKSVKYSVLYMKAIKALQEAVTRIETLEAEVAALKGAN